MSILPVNLCFPIAVLFLTMLLLPVPPFIFPCCFLCVDPNFTLCHNSLRGHFSSLQSFRYFIFITFKDAKWSRCSAPSHVHIYFGLIFLAFILFFFKSHLCNPLPCLSRCHMIYKNNWCLFGIYKISTRCRHWQCLEAASPWFKAKSCKW